MPTDEEVRELRILTIILGHIDNNTLSTFLELCHYDASINAYDIGLGRLISKDMVDDIKRAPSHYRQFI